MELRRSMLAQDAFLLPPSRESRTVRVRSSNCRRIFSRKCDRVDQARSLRRALPCGSGRLSDEG